MCQVSSRGQLTSEVRTTAPAGRPTTLNLHSTDRSFRSHDLMTVTSLNTVT